GGLQAPQGARGGRSGQPSPRRPAPPGPPGSRGVRPDDHVDRALPAPGRGALPAPRLGPGRAGRRGEPAPDPPDRPQGRNRIMTTTDSGTRYDEAVIEADPRVPMVHITRDFRATPQQLMRAHTDPELFVRWIGPDGMTTRIDIWE